MRITVEDLKNRQIYLMPFSAEAVLMYHILEKHGIGVQGFFDNKSDIGLTYCKKTITPPRYSSGQEPILVVMCGFKNYQSIQEQLTNLGIESVQMEELLVEDDIEPAISQINQEEFILAAPRQKFRLFRLAQEIQHSVLPDAAFQDDALVLGSMEIGVTEKCTLKCEKCNALMQYFEEPQHFLPEEIIGDIRLLFSKTSFVRILKVIGGEPFMHPQLTEILQEISNYRKQYGLLRLITNGTIVPNPSVCEAMKKSGTFVKISNYGKLASNREKLTEKLEEWDIPFQVEELSWINAQQITNPVSAAQGQQVFERCESKVVCNSMRNGKLYRCEFLANGEKLRVFPYDKANHVDLRSDQIGREAIRNYLEAKKAPPGCRYCTGSDKTLEKVPVAEQAPGVMDYIRR